MSTDTSKSCRLFDQDNRLVVEKDISMEEPYFQGQAWRLPDAVLHEGRHFRLMGNSNKYFEEPRQIQLIGLDGKREDAQVLFPIPEAISKDGRIFVKLNEDLFKEVTARAI